MARYECRDCAGDLLKALESLMAREAEWLKVWGMADCDCIYLSRDAEREYENGVCPHQIARALIAKHKRTK